MDGLPDDLPPPMRSLVQAIDQLLEQDMDLLAIGGHEQAICHRVAVYLEPRFPHYKVDCEYNRMGAQPKDFQTEEAPKRFRPDIIVHVRLDSHYDLLAVEAKANANPDSEFDTQKIQALVEQTAFSYRVGAILTFHNAKNELKHGLMKVTVTWYSHSRGWSKPFARSRKMRPDFRLWVIAR